MITLVCDSSKSTYLSLVLRDGTHHHIRLVIDGQDDLSDASLGQCLNLVAKDGLVAKLDQWLGHCQCHGTQTRAKTSY